MHSQQQKLHLTEFMKSHKKGLFKVLIFLTILVIGLIGFWFILKAALNAEHPIVPVYSNNMCTAYPSCDGFTHPFEHTLHAGDLIIIQGVDARTVEAGYPNSDILVFYAPKQNPSQEDKLIITRVVAKEEKDGIIYFRTKSDGTGDHKWPETPDPKEFERWHDYRENYTSNGMISEKLLVGKVIFRIPWIGHLIFFVSSQLGLLVVMILIFTFIIVRFVIPKLKKGKTEHA